MMSRRVMAPQPHGFAPGLYRSRQQDDFVITVLESRPHTPGTYWVKFIESINGLEITELSGMYECFWERVL